MTETVTTLHNDTMQEVKQLNLSLECLLKLQEMKMMKELGLPVDLEKFGNEEDF